MAEGIEVIKLPGIKIDVENQDNPLQPRYLRGLEVDKILAYRMQVIQDTFDFFDPDALIIEHYMAGLMNEAFPLILKKRLRLDKPTEFALVHLSRGIMRRAPNLVIPYQNPCHQPEAVNIALNFDFIYVLDEASNIDFHQEILGNDPGLAGKIHYLGGVTTKTFEELPDRQEVLREFNLPDVPIILISLGRHGKVAAMTRQLLACWGRLGLSQNHQVVMVIDPYLEGAAVDSLRDDRLTGQVHFLPFRFNLIDLINQAELVVCRSGYNTINEVLLTGVRALIIPEHHPSEEQERRARSIPLENVTVADADEVLSGGIDEIMLELLQRPLTPLKFRFDKYAVGRRIITDLEQWKAARG
jgi:predicted glycosyltransferase